MWLATLPGELGSITSLSTDVLALRSMAGTSEPGSAGSASTVGDHAIAPVNSAVQRDEISLLQQRVIELEEELMARSQTSDNLPSLHQGSSGVMQRRWLWPQGLDGYLRVPSTVRRFSLDVGFNRGAVTIADWLPRRPDTLFIGVEANPYLYALFEYITTSKLYPQGQEGEYWRVVTPENKDIMESDKENGTLAQRADVVARARVYQQCKREWKCLLIHAAVAGSTLGSKRPPAAVDFYLGKGWMGEKVISDVGSRFKWIDQKRQNVSDGEAGNDVRVQSLVLDDLLALVPPPPRLWWDTLKIDLQGSDEEAIVSARRYLHHFTCVNVEMIKHKTYRVVSNVNLSLAMDALMDSGFRMLFQRIGRGSIWVNLRYLDRFYDQNAYTCTTFDYNVTHEQIIERVYHLQDRQRNGTLSGATGVGRLDLTKSTSREVLVTR